MPTITQRIRSGWDAFIGRDPTKNLQVTQDFGYGYGIRPDRTRYTGSSYRSIVGAIYNRIAVDVASVKMEHAKLDDNGRFKESINSTLNECLNVEANIDQTGTELRQDIVESMFDEGIVAVVPVYTDKDPEDGSYKILELRTGKIIGWYPYHVKIHLYNQDKGKYQDIIMEKSNVAIITNPFYTAMNEPNSTAQRLMAAINKLNAQNDLAANPKLDLIVSLPYVTKSPQRKAEAKKRRKEIEDQLSNSKLGIAYTDGTEKVTQLNRPIENNLWQQVKELTEQLFSQLGVTPSILDGTADEATRINYFNSTIAPICQAIVNEFNRKFLTKTARAQKQSIVFFRDPFKLVPVSQLADIADKFTRNEIMTSNEMRAEIGYKPVDDPKANMLINKNLNMSDEQTAEVYGGSAPGETADGNGTEETTNKPSLLDSLLMSVGNQTIK